MQSARFIRKLAGWNGDARLYSVSEPIEVAWGDNGPFSQEGTVRRCNHIVVSAINIPSFGPETFVFAADRDGVIQSWMELAGSLRGSLDHQEAVDGFIASYNQEVPE